MSIFKESFKNEIRKQIEQRQSKIKNGDRTYFLQRQCTFRMASGVDVGGSNQIAKQNILEGGIKNVTSTTTDGVTTYKFSNKGGFGGAYDQPVDGYGYVPMPGITSINIRTKTAYGSLREVIVNFECHNEKQLSVLEQLYMRPGYPCLAEWGWEPYINNDGGKEYNLQFISSNDKFWKGTYTQEGIQKLINEQRTTFEGNYDGLFGIVKNFNYSVRPDGGYSCTTELIAIGEVIGSIKGELSEEDSTKHVLEQHLEDLNEYASSLSTAKPTEIQYKESLEESGENLEDAPAYEDSWLWGDDVKSDFEEEYKDNRKIKRAELAGYYFLSKKDGGLGLKPGLDIIQQSANLRRDIKPSAYIKWGALINFINDSINQDDDGKKLTKIEADPNIQFNRTSINSDIISKIDEINPYINYTGGATLSNIDFSINPQICLFPQNVIGLEFDMGENSFSAYSRSISDIYFNVTYLYKTFMSQYFTKDSEGVSTVNEDFSLGKYIKKIWDDVNKSCGNIHNFQLYNDFENNFASYIIDLEFEKPPNSIIYTKLNVLGNNSIVREFKYDLSVPSSLTSTIAIAAQSPSDASTLEQVTFAAFNKGIKNRFFKSDKKNQQEKVGNKKKRLYKAYYLTNKETKTGSQPVTDVYGNILFYTPVEGAKSAGKKGQETLWRLTDLVVELNIYLERLKGGNVNSFEAPVLQFQVGPAVAGGAPTQTSGNDQGPYSSRFLEVIKSYNEDNPREYQWNFGGDSYTDFDEIPSVDISSATSTLKKIAALSRDLQRYNLSTFDLKETAPDVTTIIPLKFSAKLDGISNIIIGNVFKIQQDKLPALYKDNNVAFIVTGESQEINGQDWTTTITGQAVLLPI